MRELFLYQTAFVLIEISFLSMYMELLEGSQVTFELSNPKHEHSTERHFM